MFGGELVAIFVAPIAGAAMEARDEVDAIAGAGLAGDRYCAAAGTYSGRRLGDPQRAVTLIEREAVAAARAEAQLTLDEAETRRNLVTAGVPLNHLVGRTFRVGRVRLRGVDLAEPCVYLEGATRPGGPGRPCAPGRSAGRDPRGRPPAGRRSRRAGRALTRPGRRPRSSGHAVA